ncbi:uncharacterized protein V6R79_008775 [Siganus canaliculatus]
MPRALLVENKLLVSQRRAGGPWTQKCVRCGAPIRVARSIPPHGLRQASWRNGKCSLSSGGGILQPRQDEFEKFCQRYFFSACNYKPDKGCVEFPVSSLLLLYFEIKRQSIKAAVNFTLVTIVK